MHSAEDFGCGKNRWDRPSLRRADILRAYQSGPEWYFADLIAKKKRIDTSIRFQLANCLWTVPAMHVWPGAKMDVSAGLAAVR